MHTICIDYNIRLSVRMTAIDTQRFRITCEHVQAQLHIARAVCAIRAIVRCLSEVSLF
jgi:hypothetical protein